MGIRYFIQGKNKADQEWADKIVGSITGMDFIDSDTGMAKFTLYIDNSDQKLLTTELLEAKKVIVAWGEDGNVTEPREVVLTKITGNLETFKIVGYGSKIWDGDQNDIRDLHTERDYHSIVYKIAKQMGFSNPDIQHPFVDLDDDIQQTQPNARFLAKLAEDVGYAFWVDPQGFHWKPRDVKEKPIIKLCYKGVITGEDFGIIVGTPKLDIEYSRNKPKSIKSKSLKSSPKDKLNKTSKTGIKYVNGTPVLNTNNRSATVTHSSQGEQQRKTYAESQEIPAKQTKITYSPSKNRGYGKWQKTSSSRNKLKITIYGKVYVLPGKIVELFNMGELFTGKFWIRKVHHKVRTGVFTMEISISRDSGKKTSKKKNNKVPGNVNKSKSNDKKKNKDGGRKYVEILDGTTGISANLEYYRRGKK